VIRKRLTGRGQVIRGQLTEEANDLLSGLRFGGDCSGVLVRWDFVRGVALNSSVWKRLTGRVIC